MEIAAAITLVLALFFTAKTIQTHINGWVSKQGTGSWELAIACILWGVFYYLNQ